MNASIKISASGILIGLAILLGSTAMGSGANKAGANPTSGTLHSRIFTSDIIFQEIGSVRSELIHLQEQYGLSLVTLENMEILDVDFRGRGLMKADEVPRTGVFSADGTEIAFTYSTRPALSGISHADGSDFRQYPGFSPEQVCWSPDAKMLVVLLNSNMRSGLYLWPLTSDSATPISKQGSLTSQCWSPDGKQIVFEMNGAVKIYEIEEKRTRELGPGQTPTWSPDGEWIAFLDRDTYYAIHPNGQGKKILFRRRYAQGPLWWSPDSGMVAYVSVASPFAEGLTLDVENYRLRVRRLADKSDNWVANSAGGSQYQWITNPKLLEQARSKQAHK